MSKSMPKQFQKKPNQRQQDRSVSYHTPTTTENKGHSEKELAKQEYAREILRQRKLEAGMGCIEEERKIAVVKNPFDDVVVNYIFIMGFFYELVGTRIRKNIELKVQHKKTFSDVLVAHLKQKVAGDATLEKLIDDQVNRRTNKLAPPPQVRKLLEDNLQKK
jgi:hypothetical protein